MRFIYIFIAAMFISSCASDQERLRESFNEGWKFSKGEVGQEFAPDFDDSSWRTLNVPHDYAIEGPFSREYDTRTGGLPVFGTAWYRKAFEIPTEYEGKVITLEFDGVMNNSEVFLNGEKVGARPYGYIGFQVDLTPQVLFGKENVLAVRVDPKELSSRWYPGAGIFRNVWLEVKDPVHVGHWGTYVTTEKLSEETHKVHVETTIQYPAEVSGRLFLETTVLDGDGKVIKTAKETIPTSDAGETHVRQEFELQSPLLWDLGAPNLYRMVSRVLRNGGVVDTYETTFGVRTIEYSRDEGFKLNGEHVKFKGVCLHHDLGPLGSAVNYRATQRQLEIMKEMGVNAIRTSHNPPSPEQLAICDEMGILVQVEAFDEWKTGKVENGYHNFWDQWHETDLRDMIRRDRNHPSVVMWSIGNEIREQRQKNGGELAAQLTGICHDEDPTRPVTAGFNNYPQAVNNGLAAVIDLVGLNYKPTKYGHFLKNNPEGIVYGSETSSCVSSRGVYHLPLENYDRHPSLQVSSYDIISPPWAYPPDFEIHAQETMKQSLGEFIWTGFDYLGEPTPYNGRDNETHGKWGGDWPSRSSYFGIVDLCGFKKDRFYFYQSVWTEEPMVHILPHWNWEDSPHKTIPVFCYTNCDEAELFLNGESLGKKVMGVDKTPIPAKFFAWDKKSDTWDSPYRLSWNVAYAPGELKVVAYKDGAVAAEKRIQTAGPAARVSLVPDREILQADGYDLSFITVRIEDAAGNLCPLANHQVQFTLDGPGTIAAVGNGDPTSTEPYQANSRKAFNGLCMLIVRSKAGEAGDLKVTAVSDQLESSETTIEIL